MTDKRKSLERPDRRWRRFRTPGCIATSRPIASERSALADLGGLREVLSASASLDVTPMRDGRVHVAGRVRARIGQTCVVTLDPIENDIDEAIDLIFAPPEQIPELADLVDDAAESDAEIPDPPEPIEDGIIDLGRLATDALFLAVDPYPRKPDAVFEPPVDSRRSGRSSVCRAEGVEVAMPIQPDSSKPKRD